MTRRAALLLSLPLALAAAAPAGAGGALETLDLTDAAPGPVAGTEVAAVVPIRWDDRCLPPPQVIDADLDPIPNPLGADLLTVADAAAVFAAAMARWNAVPTSYAALALAGTASAPNAAGFDTVNEITFDTGPDFDFIAASPSIVLIEDSLLADGDDLDGDGDPDVDASLTTCADADGDGDFERPPGFYPAGTILDNDLLFNTKDAGGFRFTVGDAALDVDVRSVDLEAVAVHELGHSLGLAHVPNNQKSGVDGTAATLFPFTDTGDPDAERAQRSLDDDDRAFVSLTYPEGTAGDGTFPGGPASLGPGDVAFAAAYGLLTGDVVAGAGGSPVAGAVVEARSTAGGALFATAYSGRVRLLVDADGQPLLTPDPGFHVLDGGWRLPLAQGAWRLSIEAVDGAPIPIGSVNFTVLVGALLGQQGFLEEGWNGADEAASETRPGDAHPVPAVTGQVRGGHRFVTGSETVDAPFGSLDTRGFVAGPAGLWYAVRFPAVEVLARFAAGDLLLAGLYHTLVDDTSVPVRFAEAALVGGRTPVDGTPRLDLARPLARRAPFVAQDDDLAPLRFAQPQALRARIENGLAQGELEDLYLVLRAPLATPFEGPNARAPAVGLDGVVGGVNDVPILGRSFVSLDGMTFIPDPRFNYMFALVFGGG